MVDQLREQLQLAAGLDDGSLGTDATAVSAALEELAGADGVLVFVEVADDMTEGDGRAFDQAVLTWMQPVAGQPRGPWWLREAALDIAAR